MTEAAGQGTQEVYKAVIKIGKRLAFAKVVCKSQYIS